MSILDWIYPPKCVACGMIIPIYDKLHKKLWLCTNCIALFEPIQTNTCKMCGVPVEDVITCSSCKTKIYNFSANYACFVYEDLVRDLLLSLKFRNKKNVAYSLGYLWAGFVKSNEQLKEYINEEIILVPVPMHPKKQRERGFNQAEILAQILSSELKIPFSNALTRTVDTPPMAGLHPTLRAENLLGAFSIRDSKDSKNSKNSKTSVSVKDKKIMLVDDIYTTGASLNECALTLKNAGANTISCMTLSITVKAK